MRAFLAVELPDTVRAEVAALQAGLRAAGADVKWVEPPNLHLTLKFFGEVEEARVPAVADAVRAAAGRHARFTLQLEGMGAFPRTTSPRVIWVGIIRGAEALTALAQAVESACAGLGFPAQERPFAPHLTIGRVRSRDRLATLIKRLQVVEFHGGPPAVVDHMTLFQSTLSPKGPTYTPQAIMPLAR